ncbi:NAD(P)H-dependent oxidoreductase [Sphingomonas donggukensis]|uniref:NAD(P)H-dependent oxidoreductase n=1 Tax=Sphingomonas donggukensis TaxID=2949093 RepID=A0ABY4TVP9_9SPHN|nr:NAD(P)H-dependent oxidoreductase [Sphingomonas donggukensis]URW75567.1 NAD(P)H-dependent oxidoreductase [Sphingomonas donggukensis]
MSQPHIVALGGTTRPQSSTGRALAAALKVAEDHGARTTLLTGDAIGFPNFEPGSTGGEPNVEAFVAALRSADGVIVGSPGYHGTFSGMVKNALDYVELMAGDERPYFHGLPVGLIATAAGWQAAVSTLIGLRSVTHALRGWPTPLGVAINTADGPDAIPRAQPQIEIMVGQMFAFLAPRVRS